MLKEALAVLARMKVRNLKANHNTLGNSLAITNAVLARMKVRNLKANHNCHRPPIPC